jgi:restriction system protein
MARRSPSGLEALAKAPWPVGVIAGVLVVLGGKVIAPAILASSGSPILSGIVQQLRNGGFDPILWVLAGACWLAALVSLAGRAKRRRMLEAQADLQTLRALSWRDFEQLVSEAYRRRGFAVEETGQGGADGGIDLVLRRDGQTTLGQCKHWKSRKVDVATVREQLGLVIHHRAAGAIVVTTGEFTSEARAFAAKEPALELVSGMDLLVLMKDVQTNKRSGQSPAARSEPVAISADAHAPPCPKCGASMVERKARQTGERFYGCSTFPRCRGTRRVETA